MLRIQKLYNDDKLSVQVVESVDKRVTRYGSHCRAYGAVEPVAIIVNDSNHHYVVDMQSSVMNIEQLTQQYPEITELI